MTLRERLQALHDLDAREETLAAATLALLAEGVAVLLFFCMVLTWIAIAGTTP